MRSNEGAHHPPIDADDGTVPGHVVQFYESDRFLRDTVAHFLAEGFAAGQRALVIATAANGRGFEKRLSARGFNARRARQTGQLTLLDAREVLSDILVDALPDPDRFRRRVGTAIASHGGSRETCVRAYGEMVEVLWRAGNPEGALRLEELWNELAHTHRFHLLCAYRMKNFSKASAASRFDDVCRMHARVFPTEGFIPTADNLGLREVTILQQRARALEHEVVRRRELEAALRASLERERTARADAEQASRVKDEFLAVISHELRTPLNAILGWAQIVRHGRSGRSTMVRALDVIDRNAAMQMHLIDDLLDMSSIVNGKMRIVSNPVDLVEVVMSALETVRPAAIAKSVDIQTELDRSARLVTGDAGRLQQVLWNLLSNAVKFTPNLGRVDVRLLRKNGWAHLVVSDTGQGIAADFLPHVFDRFRQADSSTTRVYGGLGLGLTVVRYLVEAHGGSVSAESTGLGKGATFMVTLPLRVAARPTSPL